MRKIHIATIQVAVETDTSAEACDAISDMMRSAGFLGIGGDAPIYDWQYVILGGQRMIPTEKYIHDDYAEGDAFCN